MRVVLSKTTKPILKLPTPKVITPEMAQPQKKVAAKSLKKAVVTSAASSAPSSITPPRLLKPTKQSQCIDLLSQPQGSSLEELMHTLGWQAHSIRGYISGTLRKKLGLHIVRHTVDGIYMYQITQSKI
ncbi:DUF3489 domain-containing protein [Polynucleobacter brandtiae]|uniref:Uncharacterized protein DUF3489 n=1 Tax=Polynucleobacter brandtiae TaxID=1938816 RepID=A0A2M8VJF9_9BURK|nr:DUF3489 domain-containing protein [Polynucleobacter brandtiae]PJI77144.1 uncharacterized protein DUF3489 [Polynucleobacter brandtiae]